MRILIVKTSSMGDVVHILPAVTELVRKYPTVVIDWVVEESFVDIPKIHPAVNRVIVVALRRWRKSVFNTKTLNEIKQFIVQLRQYSYEYIIDAQGLLKSAIITKFARLNNKKSYRYGFDKNSSRGKYLSWLYHKTFFVEKNQHAVHRLKQLFAEIFSYKVNNGVDYGINLGITSKERAHNRPFLIFLHCTTWESKKWPSDYWRELIKIAIDNGYSIKLNSGNSQELKQAKLIAQGFSEQLVEIMLPQSISSLIPIIAASRGVICVDTGLGHLAAALGKPGVGIFGATNPSLTSVLSNNFTNLASKYRCAPCLLRNCVELDNTNLNFPPCYKELNPEVVWSNLEHKL